MENGPLRHRTHYGKSGVPPTVTAPKNVCAQKCHLFEVCNWLQHLADFAGSLHKHVCQISLKMIKVKNQDRMIVTLSISAYIFVQSLSGIHHKSSCASVVDCHDG